jgi:hypothetical protein
VTEVGANDFKTTRMNDIQSLNILILIYVNQSIFFFLIIFLLFGIDVKIGGIKQIAIAVVPYSKKPM